MTLPKDKNPFDFFAEWYDEAANKEPFDHTAMALATADTDGLPNVRMVLLKGWGADGFVFYTNDESTKGGELADNPQAALCFHWKQLGRQVRIRGAVEVIAPEESDAYYASRDRGSRIGAWASKQSRPLEGRFALEKEVARYAAKFGVGTIDRPDYWHGYRIVPQSMEFWQHRDHRLHDRVLYLPDEDGSWTGEWLYP
jgi:pyridoxamine 5'-phosphate oxidase